MYVSLQYAVVTHRQDCTHTHLLNWLLKRLHILIHELCLTNLYCSRYSIAGMLCLDIGLMGGCRCLLPTDI